MPLAITITNDDIGTLRLQISQDNDILYLIKKSSITLFKDVRNDAIVISWDKNKISLPFANIINPDAFNLDEMYNYIYYKIIHYIQWQTKN